METNPYQSPTTTIPSDRKSSDRFAGVPYASPRVLGTFAIAVLTIAVVIDALSIGSKVLQFGLLERARTGVIGEAEADANDTREELLGTAQLGILVVTAIAFLLWVYRANRNLRPLGNKRIEFTPGWSVGWWFVPIAFYFKPFQVVKEIFLRSDPSLRQPRVGPQQGTPEVIGFWWACWIGGNIISRIATAGSGKEVRELIFMTIGMALATGLNLVAGVLAIKIIAQIDRRQDERYDRIVEGSLVIDEPDAALIEAPPGFEF